MPSETYKIDDATFQHLTAWCESQLRPAEADTVRERIIAFLEASDPHDAEYSLSHGWWHVYDLVTNAKLTPDQQKAFRSLASQLSPENLTCDGELPRAQVRRRYATLMAQWRALERTVGRSVSESEAWGLTSSEEAQ